MYSFKIISSMTVHADPNSAFVFIGPHVKRIPTGSTYIPNISILSLLNSIYKLSM